MTRNEQRRRAQQNVIRNGYAMYNRILSSGSVGSGPGTVGEEEQGEDKGDASGCKMPASTSGAEWDKYKLCEEKYWGSSAGDCHTFKKRAESNNSVDKEWCASAGGTWPEPCLELAHSCISTVVCQVFNYLYAEGQFTQECGKYGEPVGDLIWWGSGFQSASALIGPLITEIKCIGADKGSCWPNVSAVYGTYALKVYKLVEKLQTIWNTQREEAGLPPSMVCIDLPFLSIAAMIGRGEIPAQLSETARKQIIASMTESQGYKIENWSTCMKMGCTCSSQSLDLESALVEMSLWTDADGFRKTIQSNQLRFLDTDNYVFAVSHGIRSGVQLVDTNITQKFAGGAGLGIKHLGFVSGHSSGSVGAADVLEPPVRLPEEYLPLKLFYGAAQVSTAGYGSAFNIGIEQKGGPEKCKSIAATNDSKVCAGVAQIVLQQRLEALFRVVPLVVGAMTAHNAHYAMIWKRVHSPIPIDTNPSKDNVLAQAALKYAAEADSDTAGTSWLKCLLTLGVVGASGYGAWKYWPKSKK